MTSLTGVYHTTCIVKGMMTMGVMTLSRYMYNIITLSNGKLYIA